MTDPNKGHILPDDDNAPAQQEAPGDLPRPDEQAESQETPASPTFPIVGIGASAGGLHAFEQFFANMAEDSGMAFVLVQHLDPTQQSILSEILGRYTSMSVFQVSDGIQVQPNCVYVIPPNRDMALMRGHLHLIEPALPRGLRLPIDFFFRSLADELQEHAICVILSGTGTDGTLGLRAIKGAGGMVMVQEPASARYDGMPRSALDTDLVDYILPPEQMPDQLLKYTRHDFVSGIRRTTPLLSQSADALQKIFILLRNQTGHDFSLYKKSTLMRRIERRMAVNHIAWIADYIRYLQMNSQEINALFRDLFIGVTGFFRDSEVFAALQKHVIPRLLEDHSPQEAIRVWVPGCSTGEEAFSLAILFCEQMDAQDQQANVQIFATDIDIQAIEKARSGTYPASIVADVSQERLQHFFHHQNDTYQVSRRIRDMVVFAEQSVIKDPPFSNLDLISCRNLLIYLETELQQKVLGLFHRVLNPDGFLMLGTSETPGTSEHLFKTIDRRWQIFQRAPGETSEIATFDFSLPTMLDKQKERQRKEAETSLDLRTTMERMLLEHFAPTAVIVNEQGDMLYFYGKTGKYWEPSTGKADWNIFRVTRNGLQAILTMALRKAISKKQPVIREEAEFDTDESRQVVAVSVRLVPNTRLLLVVFEENITAPVPPVAEPDLDPSDERDAYILKLQRDLKSAQEYLSATNEELQASNEELRSSNEELQSSNEELRSSNEQLGTSKEELQSVNEELVTVNSELQNKIGELSRVNNYLRNLLSNIDVGIIFLDLQLQIAWYTPTATRVVHLIESDIGRPLSDLVPNIDYEGVIRDAQHVLDTLDIRMAEVRIRDTDEWYWMRISPYRTTDNIIEGVVLTFSNITRQKRALIDLRKLSQALEQSSSMVVIADIHGIIEYVNSRFCTVTGYQAEEVVGKNLRTLKVDPEALEVYEQAWHAITAGKEWHGEFCNRKKDGERYWVAASRAPVRDDQGKITHFITVEDDITERKHKETALLDNELFLRSIYLGIAMPIFVINVSAEGQFSYAGINPACERITGYDGSHIRGKQLEDLTELISPRGIENLRTNFQQVVESGEALEYEHQATTPASQQGAWWRTRLEPIKDEQGAVYRIVATTHSITELKRTETNIQRRDRALASLGTWWYNLHAGTQDEQALLHSMAHILLDASGHRAIWIAIASPDAPGPMLPGVYAEATDTPPPAVLRSWVEETAGPELFQRVLQAGEQVIMQDIQHASALESGCTFARAIPVIIEDRIAAVVTGYAAEAGLSLDDYGGTGIFSILVQNLTHGLHLLWNWRKEPS